MAKTSGSIRGTSKSGNYDAYVGIRQANGDMRYVSKTFRTKKQGQDWLDKVVNRFNEYNKTGMAEVAQIDHLKTNNIVFSRDLSKEFAARERRRFKSR